MDGQANVAIGGHQEQFVYCNPADTELIILTYISLQQKLVAVLFCRRQKTTGYLSKQLAVKTAAQIFPDTNVKTNGIKLSLQ